MRKFFWAAIPALLVMAAFQATAQSQPAPATRTLKVKLNYTGSGTVDAKHPILVFVFDGPDFQDGELPPIGQDQASAKNATLTFQEITASPVYVAAVYDPSGNYEGDTLPPPDASVGLYATKPGVPAPIKIAPGKTVQVTLSFDDSHKYGNGTPQ